MTSPTAQLPVFPAERGPAPTTPAQPALPDGWKWVKLGEIGKAV